MWKRQSTLYNCGCQSCFFRKIKRLGGTVMTDVYPPIETGNAAPANPQRLLDMVREKVGALHDSRSTEEA
jgi:hypothetical protein